MTYIEPKISVSNLKQCARSSGQGVTLQTQEGLEIECEALTDFGWSLELRYDKINKLFRPSPITGGQALLKRSSIAVEELTDSFVLSAETGQCRLLKSHGGFSLSDSRGVFFKTNDAPFLCHAERVSIFEGLMSLKVTDFKDRGFLTPKGEAFESHMVRFRYPRPTGLVLGLPGQTGEANRNGYRFELYNTDEFTHTPARKPLYQSWPILIHRGADSRWVGIFHDNPSRTFVDLGDFYPDSVTFESLTNNTRIYIACGDTIADVSTKLVRLLGGMALPPLWAFGYQQCRWSYMSSNEARQVVRSFRAEGLPLDALYFDIDYMDKFRVFTTNPETFGDLNKLIAELKTDGIRSVCIVDPGVKVDSEYEIYTKILGSGSVLKNQDGSPFVIRCWPEDALLPDFGTDSMQQLWSDLQRTWLERFPFDGVWNDMNEPSNFNSQNKTTSTAFDANGSVRHEYNLYGFRMAKASALGMQKTYPKKRTVVITRSGYPGVQQHSVIWHGDNCAWWEHLRFALDTTLQYSLCGAFYTGPDLPGFTGNPSDDLAVRFFQLGAFLPLFRGHSIFFAKDKEPYVYGSEAKLHIKNAITLRYSLLREWYSNFANCIANKSPALMPVLDDKSNLVRDQFILFDKLLVAPVLDRDASRKLVYLPKGDWYPLDDTSVKLKGDSWQVVEVNLGSLPVFVRAGSILVRNTVRKNTTETLANPETYQVYPDANRQAVGLWFNDDGESIVDSRAEMCRLVYNAQTGAVERLR